MIAKFIIEDLFGEKDIELQFEKRALIITGDNGNGKTTILNILYYILSGTVHDLIDYDFSRAIVTFKEEFNEVKKIEVHKIEQGDFKELKITYFFSRRNEPDIEINCERVYHSDKIFIDFPQDSRKQEEILESGLVLEKKDTLLSYFWGLGYKYLYQKLRYINESILYFPTYRRIDIDIEEYFNIPYKHLAYRLENRNYSNFSLKDRRVVGISNSDINDILSDYSKEINEITSENLDDLLKSFIKKFIESIMNDDREGIRITAHKTEKDVIRDRLININQILELDIDPRELQDFAEYYYKKNNKAVNFIESREKGDEASAEDFLDLVYNRMQWTEYLAILETLYEEYQKKLNDELSSYHYIAENIADFSGRKIQLVKKKNNDLVIEKRWKEVDFSVLSTGEKQLFTFLVYCAIKLPEDRPSLVIIDEPELSLHVKWQNKLLLNLMSKQHVNIISATHSPYILNKKLDSTVVRLVDID